MPSSDVFSLQMLRVLGVVEHTKNMFEKCGQSWRVKEYGEIKFLELIQFRKRLGNPLLLQSFPFKEVCCCLPSRLVPELYGLRASGCMY